MTSLLKILHFIPTEASRQTWLSLHVNDQLVINM